MGYPRKPAAPNAKGKVEAKVHFSRLRINPNQRHFESLEHLQDWTDQRIKDWSTNAICPLTGKTVLESWEAELDHLKKFDHLPQPFDVAVTRPVGKDCLIHFEGRHYSVPFCYAGQMVEVRGCATTVQIWADGSLQCEYPRGTEQRLLIDPECYEGEATERVLAPPPLGRMGRRLQEIASTPVEQRPLDLYAALAEVAR